MCFFIFIFIYLFIHAFSAFRRQIEFFITIHILFKHCSWDPQSLYLEKKIKMGPTVLFTHLKIILLYCFLCINNSRKSHKRVEKKKKKNTNADANVVSKRSLRSRLDRNYFPAFAFFFLIYFFIFFESRSSCNILGI